MGIDEADQTSFRDTKVDNKEVDPQNALKKEVDSFFKLSFLYSQGSAPLQKHLNVLFVNWIAQEKKYPKDVLSKFDISKDVSDIQIPAHHANIPSHEVDYNNTFAKLALNAAWQRYINQEFIDYDSRKEQVCLPYLSTTGDELVNLGVYKDFNMYNPNAAIEYYEQKGASATEMRVLRRILERDLEFMKRNDGRPNAKDNSRFMSYAKQYVFEPESIKSKFFGHLFQLLDVYRRRPEVVPLLEADTKRRDAIANDYTAIRQNLEKLETILH